MCIYRTNKKAATTTAAHVNDVLYIINTYSMVMYLIREIAKKKKQCCMEREKERERVFVSPPKNFLSIQVVRNPFSLTISLCVCVCVCFPCVGVTSTNLCTTSNINLKGCSLNTYLLIKPTAPFML